MEASEKLSSATVISDFESNDRLDVVIGQHRGLGVPKAELMRRAFEGFFRDVSLWETKALELNVTDESQVELMEKAKDARIFLRNIRLAAEEKRKEMKAQILVEGRALDGIVNVLKGLIMPIEDHLEKQEKFKQIREKERAEARRDARLKHLAEVAPSMFPIMNPATYDLVSSMDDAQFDIFAKGAKADHDKKIDAERILAEQAEAERKAKEEEDARVRAENERLRKEAEERDRKDREERERLEREQKERDNALAEERRRNEAKLKKEREDREKAERELAEQKKKEEDEKKAEAARRRKERTAPDREKLLNFAAELLKLRPVELKTDEARVIEANALVLLQKTHDYIVKSVKTLE